MKKYTCPMHLQVIKDKPGKCPLCGMDLVPMSGAKNEAHSHHGHHHHHDQEIYQDEILKRIALSGYDSDKFLAPDDVYAKLPECCQYERVNKPVAKAESKTETFLCLCSNPLGLLSLHFLHFLRVITPFGYHQKLAKPLP